MHKSDCVYYEIIENMEHKYFETCNKKTTCCFNCEICSDYVTLEELLAIKDSYIGDLDNNLKNLNLRCKNNISQQVNKMQNCCCIPIPSNAVPPLNFTNYCGINYREEYNRECTFYDEEHDMGATIPICTKYNKFGNFNCLNCKMFKEKKKMEINEEHDMGATIPICTKYDKFGNFNCKECYKYKR